MLLAIGAQHPAPYVLDSFAIVGEGADLIVVEGAGSPAETNLRAGDIANMGFASAAKVPVILAGDIDRGGVIASLVGTHTVIDPEDRTRIRGFLVNKFRGDAKLFQDGVDKIATLTGWPSLGVLPWFPRAQTLPAEDALDIASAVRVGARLKIAVPLLPRIANFDDLDPLKLDTSIDLRMVAPGHPLPLDADLIIIPGSKATIADLEFLRQQGWHIDIEAHLGEAVTFWDCAAVTRCWEARSGIPRGSRDRRAASKVLATWRSRPY